MLYAIARVITVIRERGLRRGTALLAAEKLRHEQLAAKLANLLRQGESCLYDGCLDERDEQSRLSQFESLFEQGVNTVERIRCGESDQEDVEFIRESLLPLYAGNHQITSGLSSLIPALVAAHEQRI